MGTDLFPVHNPGSRSPQRQRYTVQRSGLRAGCSNRLWLDEHPLHAALGETPSERQTRYREWIRASIPEDEWGLIRVAVQRGQLTGCKGFQEIVEKRIGRRVELRGHGRPRTRKK